MSKKIIFTNGLIDLAQPRLGSKVIFKTDDFFASAKRIINPLPAVFKEGLFDKNGKWMDGWESRRKRTPGHDYLIIKLGKPGSISKVDVDTSHFNGNQPSMVSLEVCYSKSNSIKNFKWKPLISKKKTKANSHHLFKTSSKSIVTHVKLNIFPDGDIARLRLYGSISKENNNFGNKIVNLTSLLNGASVVACNNEHFGKAENILAQARTSIENEKRSAMNEIKNQVADLSIDIASKVLEQELDDDKSHQEYIDKLLKEKKFDQ